MEKNWVDKGSKFGCLKKKTKVLEETGESFHCSGLRKAF